MTVQTRVRCSAQGWRQLRDELVDVLADRGLLHCPGTAGALLDVDCEPTPDAERPGRATDD